MGINNHNEKKVAFIGAGYMANEHIKAFSDIEAVKVVGIYNRTFEKAKKLADTYSMDVVATSISELYELTKADLVVITVAELGMKEAVFESLKFPWQILVEKPPGYNLSEALEIKAKADEHKKNIYVALNRRHLSSTLGVLDLLGEDQSSRTVIVNDQQSLHLAKQYDHPETVLNNWMFANSIHLVDYFSLFCRGELQQIQVIDRWLPYEATCLIAHLKYNTGDKGIYIAAWESPGPWSVQLLNSKVYCDINPLEKARYRVAGERKWFDIDINKNDIDYKPGIMQQALEAMNMLKDKNSSLPNLNDAIKTMNIIQRMYFPDASAHSKVANQIETQSFVSIE